MKQRLNVGTGPVVLHQVPDGAILPAKSGRRSPRSASPQRPEEASVQPPLVDFSAISDYIIPRQELCNTLLAICSSHLRVIGFPVCIVDPDRYARNEFIFNFALVVDENADKAQWEGVVRKLARLGRSMEEESRFLSLDEEELGLSMSVGPGGEGKREGVQGPSKVYALCEMIMEDLNNYCESMIPIDDTNTLNLKLFPTYPNPPRIRLFDVPLLTVNLATLSSPNWDLTVLRIIPFIDGVHSVAQIAQLADADVALTCRAIAHLVFYGCILLLDIFRFDACYAPTPDIRDFVADAAMQVECARYVADSAEVVAADTCVQLFTSLRQCVSLRNWCLENVQLLRGIDVRRLITFGVIKGFLYRLHKFAISASEGRKAPRKRRSQGMAGDAWSTGNGFHGEQNMRGASGQGLEGRDAPPLTSFLDGSHCFDEICTAFGESEKQVVAKLKSFRDVVIIQQ